MFCETKYNIPTTYLSLELSEKFFSQNLTLSKRENLTSAFIMFQVAATVYLIYRDALQYISENLLLKFL